MSDVVLGQAYDFNVYSRNLTCDHINSSVSSFARPSLIKKHLHKNDIVE